MDDRDRRRNDRLIRVQTFGRENAAEFAPGSKALTHFTTIDQILQKLDAAKADQTPARVTKETLLDALLLDFKNIARTARAIALTESGFDSPYRIPFRANQAELLTHGDNLIGRLEDQPVDSPAMKTAKAALRAKFVSYELPADFVQDLHDDLKAIRGANQHNQSEVQSGVGSTEAIGTLLASAAREVQELDAILKNKYARNPSKLAAWHSASRVERAPQRNKTSNVVPKDTPTP